MMDFISSQAQCPTGVFGAVMARFMSDFHRGFYELALDDFAAPEGALVLDAGCGVACHADLFRDRGLRYLGVDQSRDAILASMFDRPQDAFLIGDLANVALPSLGGAVAINVTPWLADPVSVFRNIFSALEPGASFVTGAPDIDCSRRFHGDHFRPLPQDDLREIYKAAGFRDVVMRVVSAEVEYLITRGVR